MAYLLPIASSCVHTLLQCGAGRPSPPRSSTAVHGLVLVPTRELATQVSREFKILAKVANKYLSKEAIRGRPSRVEAIAIYGGVEVDPQVESLLGKDGSTAESGELRSLVVVATAGRLLDILKSSSVNDPPDEYPTSSSPLTGLFASLQAIVFDEADRIASNVEMAGQVDEILSILKAARSNGMPRDRGDVASCLVSATLPEKAREVCDRWAPRPRVAVGVDSMKVGEGSAGERPAETERTEGDRAGAESATSAEERSEKVPREERKRKEHRTQNLDLASIPSNMVQTLHVCSGHKKPRKLIVTLRRIYTNEHGQSGRFTANNRLSIVFFGQIKTVKYASKLLTKEGLRCVELYGSLNQAERERRLLEFKAGKKPILLATDVAARGLHIPNVHYVVNYDFPGSLEQYVHRCGRAGRKQALSGEVTQHPPTVYSFFTREFASMAASVTELLRACGAWVDPNLLALTSEGGPSQSRGSNNSRRKRKRGKGRIESKDTMVKDENEDSDDDEFAYLGRCVLKRAPNISDAEDSEDEDG